MKKAILSLVLGGVLITVTACQKQLPVPELTQQSAGNIEQSLEDVHQYEADIHVSLAANGDLNRNHADVNLQYQSTLLVNMDTKQISGTSVNTMTLTGDTVAMENEAYETSIYAEYQHPETYLYTSRLHADIDYGWTLNIIPEDVFQNANCVRFFPDSIYQTSAQAQKNVSETISGQDIIELANMCHFMGIDGGLLTPELVEQMNDIQATYSYSETGNLPNKITLDLTDAHNKLTHNSGVESGGETTSFIITVELNYYPSEQIEKPDINIVERSPINEPVIQEIVENIEE